MNYIIVYFLPSIIGLSMYLYLNNKKEDIFNKIRIYMFFTLISNYICIIFDLLFKKFEYNLTEFIENNLPFAFKYLTMSIVVNILLSFVIIIVKKYVSIKIEVCHEKKNK